MKKQRIKLYLSGPMTGLTEEEYKKNFNEAEAYVKGYFGCNYEKVVVINPANKPFNTVDGLDYEDCMEIDFACIKVCDVIVLIDGWEKSKGANRELSYAIANQKEVYQLPWLDDYSSYVKPLRGFQQ